MPLVISISPRIRASRLCLAIGLFTLVAGCPVDDRKLHGAVSDNHAGSSSVGGGGGGSSAGDSSGGDAGLAAGTTAPSGGDSPGNVAGAPAAEAGEAGKGPQPTDDTPDLVDGCVDLDKNGVADCTQSRLANSNFVVDVAGWQAEPGVTVAWSDTDSFGETPSGSALVTATGVTQSEDLGFYAAVQCQPVAAGEQLAIYTDVLVASGQGTGSASLQLRFFDAANCGGSLLSIPLSAYSIEVDKWQLLSGSSEAPPSAQSVQLRLAVVKPFISPSFAVHFDNVLLDAP